MENFNLEMYCQELLSQLKDDLFENQGIEYEDLDQVLKMVIDRCKQEVQNELE